MAVLGSGASRNCSVKRKGGNCSSIFPLSFLYLFEARILTLIFKFSLFLRLPFVIKLGISPGVMGEICNPLGNSPIESLFLHWIQMCRIIIFKTLFRVPCFMIGPILIRKFNDIKIRNEINFAVS